MVAAIVEVVAIIWIGADQNSGRLPGIAAELDHDRMLAGDHLCLDPTDAAAAGQDDPKVCVRVPGKLQQRRRGRKERHSDAATADATGNSRAHEPRAGEAAD